MVVPLGLIINELVTNALKYAFNPSIKNPSIKVIMKKTKTKSFIMEISDNRKGADMEKFRKGFGSKLLEFLTIHQLKGTINSYNDNGLHVRLTLSNRLLMQNI